MEVTVTEILDNRAKFGTSQKTGKDWSMSRVGLSNGESAFIFNPIELGQVVESEQNGDYINWKAKKSDPKHDEIMKALRAIYTVITTGEAPKTPQTGLEKAREQAEAIRQKPDPVITDIGEAVSLDDIPF